MHQARKRGAKAVNKAVYAGARRIWNVRAREALHAGQIRPTSQPHESDRSAIQYEPGRALAVVPITLISPPPPAGEQIGPIAQLQLQPLAR